MREGEGREGVGGWVSEGVSRVREGVGGRGNTCMYWTCLHCALCYIHFLQKFFLH